MSLYGSESRGWIRLERQLDMGRLWVVRKKEERLLSCLHRGPERAGLHRQQSKDKSSRPQSIQLRNGLEVLLLRTSGEAEKGEEGVL